MRRYFLLLPFLQLAACELFGEPVPAPDPVIEVRASVTQGEAPLRVTFHARLEPAVTETFRWTVGPQVQTETTSTFSTTFERPGVYIVSAEAGGASDSVSLTVTGKPVTEPSPDALTVSQTPGGPAPWAVRYAVTPAKNGLMARCHQEANFREVAGGAFVCVHDVGDTVQVKFVDAAGEVSATAEARPEITENEGVAFAGRWRYSSRNKSETFTISQGTREAGSSEGGRFRLFTLGQPQGRIVEFTFGGQTVVLLPTPDDEGRQLYRGDVYGLVLEPLP